MEKMNLLKRIGIKRTMTKNEKVLLFLLGMVVFLWAAFRFAITPQKNKLYSLTDQKSAYEQEVFQLNQILKKEDKIMGEWEILQREETPLKNKYFSTINQPQIIFLINEMFSNEYIEALDVNFNRPTKQKIGDFEVDFMEVYIPFRANYQGILQTVQEIVSNPKKILITELIMDKSDDLLTGGMSMNIYGLEDSIGKPNGYYNDIPRSGERTNPFSPFDSYKDFYQEEFDYPDDDYIIHNEDGINDVVEDFYNRDVLEDFEDGSFDFIPSNQYIKGNVSKSGNSKANKYSARLEYNILSINDQNRASLELSHRNIFLKYPPATIGLWAYSYEYSPATVGIRFKDQMGEKIDLELTNGVNWTGWKYLDVTPPSDLAAYPLQMEKVYVELAKDRDDSGVLLFDGIEASYQKDSGK